MTTNKAAPEALMQELHAKVVESLLEAIKPNAKGEYNAAAISAAIRMLKDNGIEAARGTNKTIERLAERLPTRFDDDGDETHAAQ